MRQIQNWLFLHSILFAYNMWIQWEIIKALKDCNHLPNFFYSPLLFCFLLPHPACFLLFKNWIPQNPFWKKCKPQILLWVVFFFFPDTFSTLTKQTSKLMETFPRYSFWFIRPSWHDLVKCMHKLSPSSCAPGYTLQEFSHRFLWGHVGGCSLKCVSEVLVVWSEKEMETIQNWSKYILSGRWTTLEH